MANRAVIGLEGLKYALLTESTDVVGGTPTYGTIYDFPGAISLNWNPSASLTPLYTDNGLSEVGETVGDMKLDLTMSDISQQDLANMLGHAYVNGILAGNTNDPSAYLAIGGKILRNGAVSGVAQYEYVWFPKVKLTKPSFEYKTKEGKITFQTAKLTGQVAKLTANGVYKTSVRTDDSGAAAATLTNWFTTVVVSAGADLTALTVAVAAGGTAKTVTLTFTKASNSGSIPFTMSAAMLALWLEAIYMVKIVAGSANCTYTAAVTTPGAGFSNNTIVVTLTIVTGATSADNIAVVIPANSAVKDNNGVSVAATVKAPILLA